MPAAIAGALLIALACVSGSPAIATAETYFVRTSGSESNDGLTPATARASVRATARLLLGPGDQLVVGPGVYPEGNVEPYGSGRRDDPILLLGDISGELTGDAPGPVVLRPPNTPDATTGFIVYGKHDLVIEGFTIEGAEDAGIQVRPHAATAIDSTRVSLRGNEARGSGLRGIDVIAAGDVEVVENVVVGNALTGISVRAGNSLPIRPFVSANRIEQNTVGIAAENVAGGGIAGNLLSDNGRGIGVIGASDLEIRENTIVRSRDRPVFVGDGHRQRSSNVVFADNRIDQAAYPLYFITTGPLTLVGNRISETRSPVLIIESDATGEIEIAGNDIEYATVTGGAALELRANRFQLFGIERAGSLVAHENHGGTIYFTGSGPLDVQRNELFELRVSGGEASVEANLVSGSSTVWATSGRVVDNDIGGWLKVAAREPSISDGPDASRATLRVERNSAAGLDVGTIRGDTPDVVVRENDVEGPLWARSSGLVRVEDNVTKGIVVSATQPASTAIVVRNVSRDSAVNGIAVDGRGSVLIASNEVTGSRLVGVSAEQATRLRIAGNVVRDSLDGGIRVNARVPRAGDCNSDGEVTVDELVTAIAIALGEFRIGVCLAIDVDEDASATVDEISRAITIALRGIDPLATPEGLVSIHENVVAESGGSGISVHADAAMEVTNNEVIGSGGVGIFARAADPRAGLVVSGSTVGPSAAEGIVAWGSEQALVESNRVFSSGQEGVLVRDAPAAAIVNNLVYGNRFHGISFGNGSTIPTPAGLLMNNTIHANGRWGVTIGTPGASAPGTNVLNNIVSGNGQGGIAAEFGSSADLWIAFNLNNDGYSDGVLPTVTDFEADPRWVAPAGDDGTMGGAGYADDSFHLSTEPERSPAIDAGSGRAASLGIKGSAIAGTGIDEGIVDLGYHYPPTTQP